MKNAKEGVALSSVIASAAMAVMKLVVGLLTGSLGILSEAAHSLLDLGAATLTLVAVRVSDEPADARHPYGHGKVESVSALVETGLLFVTAAWIVKEAIGRLIGGAADVRVTWYGIAVILVSMVIDIGRSRALSRVAKATASQALEADALHFSTDILSSAVVLVGLGLAAFGWQKADAVAAIGVAMFVVIAGWRLGERTLDVLMDAAPDGIVEQVTAILAANSDIVRIEHVRARRAGATVFVEALVGVNRALSQEQVHLLRVAMRNGVRAALPQTDPLIVAEPIALDDESVAETVRVIAANQGLGVHDVSVFEIDGRRHVGFDLEVEDALTVKEAHDLANQMEDRLAQGLGSGVDIDIHLDPRRGRVTAGEPVGLDVRSRVEIAVAELAAGYELVRDIHKLFIQNGSDGLYISFHCVFPDEAPLKTVHAISARLEHDIMQRLGGVARVVVHVEPQDHTDRQSAQ
jgi:cation diffusion facilitator family transporter